MGYPRLHVDQTLDFGKGVKHLTDIIGKLMGQLCQPSFSERSEKQHILTTEKNQWTAPASLHHSVCLFNLAGTTIVLK